MLQTPFHTHEKGILQRINVLLKIQDVALVGGNKARHIMHQSGLVRTVDE